MALTGAETILNATASGSTISVGRSSSAAIALLGLAVPPRTVGALANAAGTVLTASLIVSGLVTRTGPTDDFTDTIDTAAAIIAALSSDAPVSSSWLLVYRNTLPYFATLAAGTGITQAGIVVVPPNSALIAHVAYTGAAAVTMTGLAVVPLAHMPATQYTATDASNGTFEAGDLEGAAFVAVESSVATAMTTRTAAQMIAGIPNFAVGMSYRLRVINTKDDTLTLTGGSGVTIAGTATLATETWREYLVIYTGASALTMQDIGAGAI